MTFLHKLARRLSVIRSVALVGTVLLGCAKGEEREFLSPNPATPSSIVAMTVSPRAGSVRPGETIRFTVTGTMSDGKTVPVDVDWAASGGRIGSDGVFVSDRVGRFSVRARARSSGLADSAAVSVYTSPTDILVVKLSPDSAEISEGEGLKLEAVAVRADGVELRESPLAWSSDGGSVDGGGWFSAAASGSYVVKAETAVGVEGSAAVKVRPTRRVVTRVSVAPGSTTLSFGQSKKFDAIATYDDGSQKALQVSWSSTGGTIGSDGTYIAGSTTGNYQVVGRDKQSAAADTAFVSVTEPTVASVSVSPDPASLVSGATQQYVLTATMSDGTSRSIGAAWQATGGTISGGGLYVAGGTAGSYRVVASVAGTGVADTAAVTVAVPTVALTQIVVNPGSASVPVRTSRQFSATAVYSDGSTRTPQVTWAATGGSVSAAGLYTAGATQGTYRVIATEPGGKADTSAVTVIPPQLEQLVVSPASVTLQPAGTQQFTVSGLWSDGSTLVPPVTWTAQGGSISTGGLYTAGSASGTFPVIARHDGGTLADTSFVTVEVPAPVLTAVSVSPASVTVAPAGTWQFTVSGTWTNGGTGVPKVSWAATGGTISSNGLFTAGSATGTFRVVAVEQGGTLADTSSVTVTQAAPTLTGLAVSPKSTSLQTAGSRQFSVSGTWSDGGSGVPAVAWAATGGTITNGGLYVAGTTAGTYRVIAAQSGGGLADTAVVTVSAPATLVSVAIQPDSGVVMTGTSQQFSAVGTYSTGGTGSVTPSWSATGGTITTAGLYTAGASAGNFRVIAASGGLADTAGVRVTSTATLTSFALTPASVSLAPGATQQFTTAANWSDGQSRPYTVAYSATGGTISSGGLYTAGQAAGAFMLIASCTCGVADTSPVTVATAPAPALVAVRVSPDSAVIAAGATFQFSASATWSDGSTTSPAVSWTATGGTVSGSGFYTAPATAGTWTVRATDPATGMMDTSVVRVSAAPGGTPTLPELPRILINTTYVPPTGRVISVAAGGDLQAAINAAACGDEVQLAAGATYTGNYSLPARQCATNPIHIRTAGTMPPVGVRVNPAIAAGFAKVVTPNSDAALKALPSARGYRIMAVAFTAVGSITLNYGLVRVGESNEASVDVMPGYVTFDRIYVHGHPTLGVSRCVTMNGVYTAVIESYLSECHAKGWDSQAIAGWNGPGPFKIFNNYLEGAGENLMFGGSDPQIQGLTPSDIEIRNNHVFKPLAWQPGAIWSVKNLLEFKHAQRVLLEGNVFENNWIESQSGPSIVLFSTAQQGSATWSVVQDVTFRYNVVKNVPGGFNFATGAVGQPLQRIGVEQNLLIDVGPNALGSYGKIFQVLGNTRGITIRNNTALFFAGDATRNSALTFGGTTSGFVAVNNILEGGTYGMIGTGTAPGAPALSTFAPDGVFQGNVLTGPAPSQSPFPAGNFYPPDMTSVRFVSLTGGDYTLSSTSPYLARGTDGRNPGVDFPMLQQKIAGVAP